MKSRHHAIIHHGSLTLLVCGVAALLASLSLALQGWLGDAHANSGVFSSTNAWNIRIPRTTPVVGTPSVSASLDNDGPTYYTASSSAPLVNITEWDCDGDGMTPGLAVQWQNVPLPANAVASSSGKLILFQASTQTLWEFSGLRQTGSDWEACAGGRIQATSSSNGNYPSPFGLTGSGVSFAAGEILLSELSSGVINHVVGLSLPNVSGTVSWPATRSNGSGGSLAMGQRLRLDSSVDVDSLGLPSFARMVAHAAQDYGLIIWDSGSASVKAESPAAAIANGQPNPYASLNTDLSSFPWNKLQTLPLNYGQSGIQPQITSFSQSASTIGPGQTVTLEWEATNVDYCAVPPHASHLPATGSWQSSALSNDIGFTLVCGGVAGSTSRQADVRINQTMPTVTPPILPDGQTLALSPVSGLAVILPELSTEEAALIVQHVEYFEREILVSSVTAPPFGLDTTKLPDGPHILDMTIYYRDGHSEKQRRTITIANSSQSLLFASVPHTSRIPNILATIGGIAILLASMGFAVRRGIVLAHLD